MLSLNCNHKWFIRGAFRYSIDFALCVGFIVSEMCDNDIPNLRYKGVFK